MEWIKSVKASRMEASKAELPITEEELVMEEGLSQPSLSEKSPPRWKLFSRWRSAPKRPKTSPSWIRTVPGRRTTYIISVIIGIATLAVVIWYCLLIALVARFNPPKPPTNGLTNIVSSWAEPNSVTPAPPSWLPGFSRDVIPKAIHSHNDYWRSVPLFEALSDGITGVEADVHLINGELYVAHTNSSIDQNRTLRSLYLDPLTTILENQNAPNGIVNSTSICGVWEVDPSRTLVLMTDMKTEGLSTFDAVQEQLAPLREKGWLTIWNGSAIVPGPITIVGTGNTPFSSVLNSSFTNSTYRSIFFDAPLDNLSSIYNASNSYYTSTSLESLLGGQMKIPLSGLTDGQLNTVKAQITQASNLGLVSRYWEIPGWPVVRMTTIWRQLEELNIGMLNADAIDQAARFNWRWCNILGLELC